MHWLAGLPTCVLFGCEDKPGGMSHKFLLLTSLDWLNSSKMAFRGFLYLNWRLYKRHYAAICGGTLTCVKKVVFAFGGRIAKKIMNKKEISRKSPEL